MIMSSIETSPELQRTLKVTSNGKEVVICSCRGTVQEVMSCKVTSDLTELDITKRGYDFSIGFPSNVVNLQNNCASVGLEALESMIKKK